MAESIFNRGNNKIVTALLPLYLGNMYINTFYNEMHLQRMRMWLDGTTGLKFLHSMDLAGKLYLAALYLYYFITMVYPRSIMYRKQVKMSFSSSWLVLSLLLYKHFKPKTGNLILMSTHLA